MHDGYITGCVEHSDATEEKILAYAMTEVSEGGEEA